MKSALKTKHLTLQLLLFFLLSNLLVQHLSCRFDASNSERLSLSQKTQNKLSRLKSHLYIDAYYSSDLPIEYNVRLELIREFLNQVKKQNPDLIHLNMYDPNQSTEIREKALKAGIVSNEIQKASDTSASSQEAFMGVVVKYDEGVDVISDLFFVEEAEMKMMRSIRKIEQRRKIQNIAIAVDPGILPFPEPGNGSGIYTWGVFYHQAMLEEYGSAFFVSLNESEIPSQIKLLIVVGSPEWTEDANKRFDSFLAKGGSVILLLSPMQFQLETLRNEDGLNFKSKGFVTVSRGFGNWIDLLSFYGFSLNSDLIFDFEHPVSLSKGGTIQKKYYPLWHYAFKSSGNMHLNHDLTNGKDFLFLPWVSSVDLEIKNQTEMKYETILWSDSQSWHKKDVFQLQEDTQFTESEMIQKRVPVGILAEGRLKSKFTNQTSIFPSRIFLVSTAYLVSDIFSLPEFRAAYRDTNVNFMLNVIDFMLDDNEYISVRNKKTAVLPLNPFSTRERNVYSAFNVIFLTFLSIAFAVRRIQKRYSGKSSV